MSAGAGSDAMNVQQVVAADWHQAVSASRDEGYTFFDWLSAVDETDADDDPGFDVVCRLLRMGPPLQDLILRTRVTADASLSSITDLFAGAAWHERETHEMFGIDFAGFEDGTGAGLRPLLLPEGFEGTPLRKSFVLAARVSKPWPGAKEPGESDAEPSKRPARRRVQAPGLPDPSWGPR